MCTSTSNPSHLSNNQAVVCFNIQEHATALTQSTIMKALDKEHVMSVVNTIFRQLVSTTPADVICSWGVSSIVATQIVQNINGDNCTMAALVMTVDGLQFSGNAYVAYDEESDYYRIYAVKPDGKLQEYRKDVAFDEIGSVLDQMIEKGSLTQQEYEEKISALYNLKVITL